MLVDGFLNERSLLELSIASQRLSPPWGGNFLNSVIRMGIVCVCVPWGAWPWRYPQRERMASQDS